MARNRRRGSRLAETTETTWLKLMIRKLRSAPLRKHWVPR